MARILYYGYISIVRVNFDALPGILYMYRVGTVATISCVHLSVKLIVVKYTNAQHLNENCLPLQGSAS